MAARATQTGPDSYDVKWDSGEEYKGVPYESARAAAPDSFSEVNEWAAQHAGGMNTEPVMPGAADPYSDANLYETVEGDTGGPMEQPGDSFMADMPAQPGGYPEAEGTFDPVARQGLSMEPQAPGLGDTGLDMAAQPPWAGGSQEQSYGRSVSGTGPYQQVSPTAPPALPDYGPAMDLAQEAAGERIGAFDEAGAHLAQSIENRGGLERQAAEHRRKTVEQSQQMHENAMEEVREQEERLSRAMENVSRMDMNKVWQDTSATAKFGGIMAAGVAGWLNPTGKNSVIEQMMQMVDQSARDQAANIATEKFGIQGQERALGRLEDRAEDSEKRYLAQRAMLLANIDAQVAHEEAKYDSVITLNNFAQMKAGVKEELGKTFSSLSKMTYDDATKAQQIAIQQEQFRASEARRAAEFKMAERGRNRRAAAARQPTAAPPIGVKGQMLTSIEGVGKIYADPDMKVTEGQRNKVSAIAETSENWRNTMNEINLLIAEHGRATNRADNKRMMFIEAKMGDVIDLMRDTIGANVPESEIGQVLARVGNPQKMLSNPEVSMSIINEQIAKTPERIRNKLKSVGGQYQLLDPESGRPMVHGDLSPVMVDVSKHTAIPGYDPTPIDDIIPQHIKKYVSDLETAKKSHARVLNKMETLRNAHRSAQAAEPAVGKSKAYVGAVEDTPEYQELERQAGSKGVQVGLKANEMLTETDRLNIDSATDPEVHASIMQHLSGVEDIAGLSTGLEGFEQKGREILTPEPPPATFREKAAAEQERHRMGAEEARRKGPFGKLR